MPKKFNPFTQTATGIALSQIPFVGWRKNRDNLRPPSDHKRHYRRGRKIKTVAAYSRWGGAIYWNHKFLHPSFFQSMPYREVARAIYCGIIRKAIEL